MKERRYFQFFRNWYEPLTFVRDRDVKLRLLEMIIEFSLYGKEPTKEELSRLDEVGRMFWETNLSSLKNSRKNFLNGSRSPGAPKGSRNAAKFEIPSLDDVYAYFGSHGYVSDPNQFFDYNSVTGWNNCKKHFKNWETAADRWEEKGDEYDE